MVHFVTHHFLKSFSILYNTYLASKIVEIFNQLIRYINVMLPIVKWKVIDISVMHGVHFSARGDEWRKMQAGNKLSLQL